MVEAGAFTHALDLSIAVDANRRNIGYRSNYVVAQADLRKPPFLPGSFEFVLALGMIQHTPSPEETIKALYELVQPGGCLCWTTTLGA
jgi:2-polyprenyl-3-methyl-5-hydroxy-6-metoxy-1,4-benzoquinol methylase